MVKMVKTKENNVLPNQVSGKEFTLVDYGNIPLYRWQINMATAGKLVPCNECSPEERNQFFKERDTNIKCPCCNEYTLPKYYTGSLAYWELDNISYDGLEVCDSCQYKMEYKAREDQQTLTYEELGLMREWLKVSVNVSQ